MNAATASQIAYARVPADQLPSRVASLVDYHHKSRALSVQRPAEAAVLMSIAQTRDSSFLSRQLGRFPCVIRLTSANRTTLIADALLLRGAV